MHVLLVRDFEIERSVAALSLLAVKFYSSDAALNYIQIETDRVGDDSLIYHPFVGYHEKQNNQETEAASERLDDLEANIELTSFNGTVCYICQKSKSKHFHKGEED